MFLFTDILGNTACVTCIAKTKRRELSWTNLDNKHGTPKMIARSENRESYHMQKIKFILQIRKWQLIFRLHLSCSPESPRVNTIIFQPTLVKGNVD